MRKFLSSLPNSSALLCFPVSSSSNKIPKLRMLLFATSSLFFNTCKHHEGRGSEKNQGRVSVPNTITHLHSMLKKITMSSTNAVSFQNVQNIVLQNCIYTHIRSSHKHKHVSNDSIAQAYQEVISEPLLQ